MPLYDVRCATCGAVKEVLRSYEDRDKDLPACCGQPMARVFLPPQVISDIEPYQSMADGSWISSRSQHRDHLKRHNCIEVGNERPPTTRAQAVPRASIRGEIKRTVERMKQEGTFRVR